MFNSVQLNKTATSYDVNHQGKIYTCARVSTIIEQTSETPRYLKQWIVNCGVEILIKQSNNTNVKDLLYAKDNGVIEKQLKKLAWQAHQVKSQQALDVGTKVHHWIKAGAIDEAQACDESRACWESYQAFAKQYTPVSIAQEIALYDITNLFAGTMDWVGILTPTTGTVAKKNSIYLHLLDWKTSKSINRNYKIQICVYKHMFLLLIKEFINNPSRFNEQTTRIINDIILAAGKNPKIVCGIVRLPKKPRSRRPFEFVTITAKEEKAYLKEFALMAKLHNHRTKESE